MARLDVFAVPGLPLVERGDDLSSLIADALSRAGLALQERDVVVVAQKIVSKSEGRIVDLHTVQPSPRARSIAEETRKDARLVEVILSESRRIVRKRPDLLIVEHRLGYIVANAGVDQSNVGGGDGGAWALMLPVDADASAQRMKSALDTRYGSNIAVVVNDSFGRPWRRGTAGVALGSAGLPALLDVRGRVDLFGRTLQTSVIGFADEVASAASLLMGQADEARPVVVLRGLQWSGDATPARALVRPESEDLFR
jgi:coenzyme F420-0:L-glutamate ligase / coenzyme F420-1:gamma-L-glutamate ligase